MRQNFGVNIYKVLSGEVGRESHPPIAIPYFTPVELLIGLIASKEHTLHIFDEPPEEPRCCSPG